MEKSHVIVRDRRQVQVQTGYINVPVDLSKKPRFGESIIQGILFLCGFISIFTTLGIVVVLGNEFIHFFQREACATMGGVEQCEVATFKEFLTTTTWQPQILNFGVLPLLSATLMITLIAALVALPSGLGAAIYLSEYASGRTRNMIKPILEILAGVPTVVYGFFALTFITPGLRELFGNDTVSIYNLASAGIVVGILIIPLIASLSEDALNSVPPSLREGSLGLGATKHETVFRVVLPAALSGVLAAFIVAVSRAIGETMIVAIAAGAGPNFTANPFHSAETMTGHIARISGGDISYDSIDYNSLFAIGLMLFMITLSLNVISRRIVARYREVYD